MLEAKIHKEITEYEGKLILGMTGKQILCCLIAVAIAVPLFFLLYTKIGIEAAGYICMLSVLPVLAIGFVKYKGRRFPDLIKMLFNFYSNSRKLRCVNIVATDYLEKGENKNDRDNRKAKSEYEYTEFYHYAGTRKQLKEKRKEIKNDLTTYKTQLASQAK